MTNVTFAVAVKHWGISLSIMILVKYFELILFFDGIVQTTRKSSSNHVIFYLLFIPYKESFLILPKVGLSPGEYN